MKTKIIVSILIIALFGSAAVQAQEKKDKEIKKEMRKLKRDLRQTKKDLIKDMKDFHFDALHFDGEDINGIYFNGDDAIIIGENRLEHLEDLLQDLDGLDFIDELEPMEHFYEFEPYDFDFDFDFDYDFEIPEMYFEMPEFDFELPEIEELIEIKELEELKELEKIDELAPNVFWYSESKSESGSLLSLSKDLDDVSISKDFYFEVKEGTSSLSMNIDGTLSSGDLTITVKKPDGELFQKFQVSPLADVDWSQQIDLDKESEKYTGKWTINLSGTGASGNYSLRFKAK